MQGSLPNLPSFSYEPWGILSAASIEMHRPAGTADRGRKQESSMSSVVKKRRKKMRKHKHRKMLKKTRWQRKHK
jgi:hypothetical protein